MDIKLVFTKVGCSIGEVVLTNCANIQNVVPDLAMSIYGIHDGWGYDTDQVSEEWANVYNNFSQLLEAYRYDGLNFGYIDLLLVNRSINVHFI